MQTTSTDAPPPASAEDGVGTGTGSTETSAERILCVRTMQQVSEPIPYDVQELLPEPSDEDEWVRCLVPASQIDLGDSQWAQVKHLPPFHVVAKTPDTKFYDVAVCKKSIQWLFDHQFPFHVASDNLLYNLLEPREGEVRVFGINEAKKKAQYRFIRNAVDGIYASHGRGLDRHYRRMTNLHNRRELMTVEWAIMVRDILASPRDILDRFFLCSLVLGLHMLGDLCSTSAAELLERKHDKWVATFQKLSSRKTTFPVDDVEAEMHEMAVLRGLFEFVGGKRDGYQHHFNTKRSPDENLAILGQLLDIDYTDPISFANFDVVKMQKLLIQGKIFPGVSLDLDDLQQKIHLWTPIGITTKVPSRIPATLFNALGCHLVDESNGVIAKTYRQVPLLRISNDSDNDMLVVLCHCASFEGSTRKVHHGARTWAASEEGIRMRQKTIRGLRGRQTSEQAFLSLSALLCYEVLRQSPDEVLDPTYTSYLSDFDKLLNGHHISHRRAVLERMAFSAGRVAGRMCHSAAHYFLDIVVDTDIEAEPVDIMLDHYWGHKLSGGLTHAKAWAEVKVMSVEAGGYPGGPSEPVVQSKNAPEKGSANVSEPGVVRLAAEEAGEDAEPAAERLSEELGGDVINQAGQSAHDEADADGTDTAEVTVFSEAGENAADDAENQSKDEVSEEGGERPGDEWVVVDLTRKHGTL